MALTAYSVALASNSGIALWLESSMPDEPPVHRSTPVAAAAASATVGDTSVILRRNLFGSEPAPAADDGGAVDIAAAEVVPELILRGTAASGAARYAVFQESGSKRQDVFSLGERIFDGPELVEVRDSAVVVVAAGRRYTIELESAAAQAPGTGATGAIRNTAPGRFLVDRREVDHSIDNLNKVVTELRAVPLVKDGKSLGFRIFNIRPGSVIDRMGLANGDVVQSVNGVTLDEPSKALAMLEDLRTADRLTVDLLRKNKPTTLIYDIR
jgi:general secretion pathway protein C